MGTLGESITTTLERVRLSTSVTDHRDQARTYLSMMAAEYQPLVPGWFLDRETTFRTTLTFTITGAAGTFTAGETITGATSLATATVDSYDSSGGLLYVYGESGDFTASETITGGSSGATATYSSSAFTRTYQPISGQVTAWHNAVNETQNWPLDIIGPSRYDESDPDRDLGTNATGVHVGGLDATTGRPVLHVWPADAVSGDVIRLRYRMDIAAWTSADDSTSMQVLGVTRALESLLIYEASRQYLEENRQYDMANVEAINASRALTAVRKQATAMQGNRQYLPKTYGSEPDDDDIVGVIDSTLVTAAS